MDARREVRADRIGFAWDNDHPSGHARAGASSHGVRWIDGERARGIGRDGVGVAIARSCVRRARDGTVGDARDFARRRDAFWDTVSAYGGRGECWMALRATCEGSLDEDTAREAVLASGIVSWTSDLSVVTAESGQPMRYRSSCERRRASSRSESSEEVVLFVVVHSVGTCTPSLAGSFV